MNPHDPARPRRAVVSGAGIAGLAAALRLSRDGWRVRVVERAPGRRSSGYLVNLMSFGFDAAERLGLIPALRPHDLGAFTSILVRADGREKFRLPAALSQAALGERAMTVFRGDLETALYEAVRETVEFRFGTTVTAVDQDAETVRATLSDGTVETAELLIGADGLHSGVRELVFGPESEHRVDLDHVVAAYPLPRPPEQVEPGSSATFIGPLRTAALVNLGERSSAFFTYRCEDARAERARGAAASLAKTFGDLGGGFPDALRRLESEPGAYFDSVSQIDMDSWHRGRVVLVGDAAWCVTVFAGYGAALAIDGADRLGTALAAADSGVAVEAALSAWEAELRPEVAKRQRLARKGTAQFCPPTKTHVFARDLAMRAILLPGIRQLILRSLKRATR